MNFEELKQFRLVGGTALSLLYGHRASIDLDLFSDEPFEREQIIDKIATNFAAFSFEEIKSPRLFFTFINNVKVDFVQTFEKFSYDYTAVENIRFASVQEIIALKLNAIAGRGAKKDFWDLYELLNHFSFREMMSFYQTRYPQNSLMMVLKSVPYFVEADMQPDPICFKDIKWDHIKKEITKKFNIYIQNIN